MKTFAELMVEAEGFQGKFTPDPDTKKQAITLNNKVTPKRKPGGALALRPADKAASIVRSKEGATSKEAVGKTKLDTAARKKPSKGYMSEPDTSTSDKPGQKPKPQSRNSDKPKKDNAFGKGFNRNMGPLSTNKQTRDASWAKAGGSLARGIRNAPGNVVKGAMRAKTTQDGPAESGSGSSGIQSAKRGVYNG